jgi:hypothetical protein
VGQCILGSQVTLSAAPAFALAAVGVAIPAYACAALTAAFK